MSAVVLRLRCAELGGPGLSWTGYSGFAASAARHAGMQTFRRDVPDRLRWDPRSRRKEGRCAKVSPVSSGQRRMAAADGYAEALSPPRTAGSHASKQAGGAADGVDKTYRPRSVSSLLMRLRAMVYVCVCREGGCRQVRGRRVWSSSERRPWLFEEEKWAGCNRVSALNLAPKPVAAVRRGRGRINGRTAPRCATYMCSFDQRLVGVCGEL